MKTIYNFGPGVVGGTLVNPSAVFTAPAQQTTILELSNVQYPRNVVLSTNGITVSRYGVQAGIAMADLMAAMIIVEPTLSWPPRFTTQPANFTAQYGGQALLIVAVSSELSVSYQWQVSTNGGSTFSNTVDGAIYTGSQTASLVISNCSGLNNYQYKCVASNGSGSTTSSAAILTVADPGITVQPSNALVSSGSPASFSITAFGATTLSYQWSYSTDGITWTAITAINAGSVYTGYTSSTLSITNSAGLNGYQYRCVVTDAAGSNTSNSGTLTTH